MALKAMIVQLLVTLVTVNFAMSTRIAGFSPTNSGSHYFTIKKVMEELSARGHEVRSKSSLQVTGVLIDIAIVDCKEIATEACKLYVLLITMKESKK